MVKLAKEYDLDIILAVSFIVFIIVFLLFITLHAVGIIGKPGFINVGEKTVERKTKAELTPSLICEKQKDEEGLEFTKKYTFYLDDNQLKYLDIDENIVLKDIDDGIFNFREEFERREDRIRNHNYFEGVSSSIIDDGTNIDYTKSYDYHLLDIEGFTKRIGQPDGSVINFSIENTLKLNSSKTQIQNYMEQKNYLCN